MTAALKNVDRPTEAPRTLAAALVAAQRAAKAVEKDSVNRFHNYAYASAEAIMGEAREALNAAGLATITQGWELLPPTHDGAPERVRVLFLTVHEHSSETKEGAVEYFVIPEKGRPLDKATATALTHAEAYYLRGLLCLPRVDPSEDVDQRDDRQKTPPPPRPAQRQPEPEPANDRADDGDQPVTPARCKKLNIALREAGNSTDDARHLFCDGVLGLEKGTTKSTTQLTNGEARLVYEAALKAKVK